MSTATVPAVKEEAKAPATIRQIIEGDLFKEQLAKALPKHLTPKRFIRIAVTTMTRVPMLAQCDQASFFNALLTLSQMGLEPDGRLAHLIPFKNNTKGIIECQLIIDYKGIVELIHNTGDISYIHADVVCENDIFVYDKGELKKHTVDFKNPRGAMYAAYTLFRFKDGTEKVEVMTKEEIDAIRKRSKAATSGPWVTDYNEMAKKTTLRRGSKWVRLQPEQREIIDKDDDQLFDHEVRQTRDTGAELAKRFDFTPVATQEAAVAIPDAKVDTFFHEEGLDATRLALRSKIGDMTAWAASEMFAVLSSLSGGKITTVEGLISADDKIVKDMLQKVSGTGGK